MSNVWAVAMVRDEEDIVEATVRQMARQVDWLLVADNGSTDGTRGILDRLAVELDDRLIVVDDPDPAYYQSFKMTRLARVAVEHDATWVVPFDADEWWYCPHAARIADWLEGQAQKVTGVTADIYDHVVTELDNQRVGYPARMGWRRVDKLPLHKMAGRAAPGMVIEQGNHHVRFDGGATAAAARRGLVVRHFPYRSAEQLIRKVRNGAAAYAATEGLAPDAGAHWRKWGAYTDDQIRQVFADWYSRGNPRAPHTTSGGDVLEPLIFDPAPVSGP